MKLSKLLFVSLSALLSLPPAGVFAQTGPGGSNYLAGLQYVLVAPSGSCNSYAIDQQVVGGALYACKGGPPTGTWTAIGGGSGGSGTVNSGTTGQSAFYPGNGTAVSGSSAVLFNGAGALQSITAFSPNTASSVSPVESYGFLNPDGNCIYLQSDINQGGGTVTVHALNDYISSTNFVNQIDPAHWWGWNITCGGGPYNSSDPLMAEGMEMTYTPSGTPGGVWPPTAQGQSQDERHFVHSGINWIAAGQAPFRHMTEAFDTLTGADDFHTERYNSGWLFAYGTNDGNLLTGVTVTMSGATATFTYSSGFPFDYVPGSEIVVGCAVAAVPSCSNFTPAGYNTVWTITGFTGNPGASCAGRTSCTATAAGVTGLASGSGGNLYGAVGAWGTITPTGITMKNLASNSVFPQASIGQVGTGMYSSLQYTAGSTAGGQASAAETDVYGSQGSVTTCNNLTGINKSNLSIFVDGTVGGPLGTFCAPGSTAAPSDVVAAHVGRVFGLYPCPSCSLTMPNIMLGFSASTTGLNIATNWASTSSALSNNNGGFWITSNGGGPALYAIADQGGTGFTALTALYLGGWSGITTHLVDGATDMIAGDGSGDPNLLNTVKYHGTAGVSVSGILCTATFTTVAGGVTACTATSDPRLKVYAPFERGLEAIMALQPIHFHWNETGLKTNSLTDAQNAEQVGFNAANVKSAMPEAVGTELHDGVAYLSLPQGDRPIVAALVNAVQEQQKEIADLRARIEKLETK